MVVAAGAEHNRRADASDQDAGEEGENDAGPASHGADHAGDEDIALTDRRQVDGRQDLAHDEHHDAKDRDADTGSDERFLERFPTANAGEEQTERDAKEGKIAKNGAGPEISEQNDNQRNREKHDFDQRFGAVKSVGSDSEGRRESQLKHDSAVAHGSTAIRAARKRADERNPGFG